MSEQSVIVCPDCGQRYDPNKAATVARAWSESTRRLIKPGRVEAQDVDTAAHRGGRHHRAHVEVTRRALDGWGVVSREIAQAAIEHRVPLESVGIDGPTWLGFVLIPELEDLALAVDSPVVRATTQRIVRAARAVRVDHPWWRAYLHELGASPEHVARGLTINNDNRADVLFERKYQPPTCINTPTLRGFA